MGPRRILILAPHPDDEIVACGIAALRARAAGARVFVLYLTTGIPARASTLGEPYLECAQSSGRILKGGQIRFGEGKGPEPQRAIVEDSFPGHVGLRHERASLRRLLARRRGRYAGLVCRVRYAGLARRG